MPPAKKAKVHQPRRKACGSCADAKVRCDHKSPCQRCQQRELRCVYPDQTGQLSSALAVGYSLFEAAPAEDSLVSSISATLPTPASLETGSSIDQGNSRDGLDDSIVSAASRSQLLGDSSGSKQPDLVCNIDAAKVQSRWLRTLVADPGDQPKTYPHNIARYISRILKSYTSVVINGSGIPPFVHATQIVEGTSNQPLHMCLRLLRICDHRLPGGQALASKPIEVQMSNILADQAIFDAQTLLSAFQAYLLYAMTLLFGFGQTGSENLREAALSLQQLAGATAADGTITYGEMHHSRPEWELWIAAEAKRRTLYTFYLFDNLLCMMDNVPTFIGNELHGMPAPMKGALWRAKTRDEWQNAYNSYLAQWQKPGVTINELWPRPASFTDDDAQIRSDRVDRWLEGADEFGVLLYAVTCGTHGD